MGIEGNLTIRLSTDADTVQTAAIVSGRPVHASRVFEGKTVTRCLDLFPLLFSVCATAQSCAAVRACENANGRHPVDAVEMLRDKLVDMETVREHLWRIFLDWPAFTAGKPDKDSMMRVITIQNDYQKVLCPAQPVFLPEAAGCQPDRRGLEIVEARLTELLQTQVFAMPTSEWLMISDIEMLETWASKKQTVAASLIQYVIENGWSAAGQCDMHDLPTLSQDELHRRFQDSRFVERPRWQSECRETTTFTRVHSSLLNALEVTFGNGLLTRLIARLTELAQLSQRLMPIDMATADQQRERGVTPSHRGIGQARAARGQLVHRVELQGGVIGRYQILAPTEWNFHPQGVVVKALSTLNGDRTQIEQQARLLINAIDPCVGYELALERAVRDA